MMMDPFHILKKVKTLLIDDDDLIRDSLDIVFKNKGCFIRTAESAEEGLRAIQEERFDLIISDLKLPGMDGLEILQLAGLAQPDAIGVLITAYRDKNTASWKTALKCVDCIEKPFSVDGLAEMLAQLIIDRKDQLNSKHLLEVQVSAENDGGLIRSEHEYR